MNKLIPIVITAVGPDNVGLADPIIHYVTGEGGNIAEIQMYDHDEEALFAMLLRNPVGPIQAGRSCHRDVGNRSADESISSRLGLPTLSSGARVWRFARPIDLNLPWPSCEPFVTDSSAPEARGHGGQSTQLPQPLAEQFGCDWEMIGDDGGVPDDDLMIETFDRYSGDYVVLARYMRVLPPSSCWKYAGGPDHHFASRAAARLSGIQPYRDAYVSRMLTYGATCHFIVPGMDAGNTDHLSVNLQPSRPVTRWKRSSDSVRKTMNRGVWSRACAVTSQEVQPAFSPVIAKRDRDRTNKRIGRIGLGPIRRYRSYREDHNGRWLPDWS